MKRFIKLLIGTLFLLQGCVESFDQPPQLEALNRQLQLLEESSYVNADSTLTLLAEVYQKYEQLSHKEGMAHCKFMMGNIFLDIGGYSQSLTHLKDALLLFNELGATDKIADVNIALSLVYLDSSDFTLAQQFAEEAVRLYETTNDRIGLAEAYGALGHIFEKTQQYDKALHYQNLALNLYEVAKDSLGLAIVHDNIGSIYEDLANYKKAKYHFEIAYQYNISKHNLIVAIINLNNLGDVHRKQKNFLAALKYTSKAYQFADEIHNDYQKRSAMRDLSKVYFALNQLDTAFHYLEESYEMTVDIFGEQTAEEVGKMKTIFEVAQKEERIARLQNEQRQERLLFIILAVAVLIFLVFGGSLYYQTIQKSKKQQKIMEIQAELSRSELENIRLNEQNLKKELENKKLLEKHLEQKLELKNKSLTTNTLQLIQKNEFLQMIRKQLNGLKKTEDKKTKQQVKRIIQAIDLKYNLEDDWAEFEHVFEQVHADFFGILQEAHPDLTPSEIRLCALIKLNLPSRNVATIMGISTNSLRMARYRLKKKLNLEKHTNLFSYLSTLVSP